MASPILIGNDLLVRTEKKLIPGSEAKITGSTDAHSMSAIAPVQSPETSKSLGLRSSHGQMEANPSAHSDFPIRNLSRQ